MVANIGGEGMRRWLRGAAPKVLPILGVAVVYYLAARIGLQLPLVRGQVTPLWPPTGVALVALLLLGGWAWPGISLGALLVNLSIGPSVPAVVAIIMGNTLAPLCANWMLRRVGFRIELDRLRDGLSLVALGALAAMLISATIGSVALLGAGAIAVSDYWAVWSVWWTGDAMGVLVIAPFLLFLRAARWPRGVPVRWWIEAAVLLASTVIVTMAVTRTTELLFLIFPLLVWAALRFQLGGATVSVLIVSALMIRATAIGSGPFAGPDLLVRMITLQAFNGSAALTGLLLAAIIAERNTGFETLKGAYQQLSEAATGQEVLRHQLADWATHDPLTGLPNRTALAQRLEWALGRPGNERHAVLVIDLDRFKDVNDIFGHPTGDDVLVDVAGRLRTAAPSEALVARLGGDEFAVLVEAVPDQREAQANADRIIEAIRPPFQADGQPIFLSVSVGLLTVEPAWRPMNPSDVLRDADFALYAAKEAGKNRVATFDPHMRAPRLDRARLGTALRQALDHGDLFLHYQPIIDLTTGDMVGVEALARWRLPGGEMIPPAEFIAAAEETGLISAVGARVLRQACREARGWQDAYGLFVSVNVSGRELADERFTDMVTTRLADCGLRPANLVLELTESSLISTQPHDTAWIQLKELRKHGIRIAIDDFGSGYSSLSRLSQLPTDIVKLDKALTQSRGDPWVPKSGRDFTSAIVQAITSLDRQVIAEGVERPEQAKALSEMGCAYGQGFLYSHPVPAADIDQMLQATPRSGRGNQPDDR